MSCCLCHFGCRAARHFRKFAAKKCFPARHLPYEECPGEFNRLLIEFLTALAARLKGRTVDSAQRPLMPIIFSKCCATRWPTVGIGRSRSYWCWRMPVCRCRVRRYCCWQLSGLFEHQLKLSWIMCRNFGHDCQRRDWLCARAIRRTALDRTTCAPLSG